MSMFAYPIAIALLGGSLTPTPVNAGGMAVSSPGQGATVTDQSARELMEQVWRRYRRIASAAVTATGLHTDADGRVEPIRTRSMIAPSGDVKVIGSTYNLTLKDGVAYADSPLFAGMQIRVKVGTGTDAGLTALADAWPDAMVPLAIRLRLATSPEAAFAPWLAMAGDSPSLAAQVGVWSDGRACEILRIRSTDGSTDLAIWIDQLTGFVRGIRGEIATQDGRPGRRIEMVHETTETERAPMIAVANRGVRPVDSYDALLRTWSEIYAVPVAPAE
jgi:hypothetical protein